MRQISIFNDTIHLRIMFEDMKKQVINEMKASPVFCLQVDKSADVTSCAKLLVFVRYTHLGDIKGEFLFFVMNCNLRREL